MLKKLQRVNILYDIYGDLLTKKQQEALKLYYFDNHSFGEIAEKYNTSRQAVFDLLKRATRYLEDMEERMKLYKKYSFRKNLLSEAQNLLSLQNSESGINKDKGRLREIIEELLKENEA